MRQTLPFRFEKSWKKNIFCLDSLRQNVLCTSYFSLKCFRSNFKNKFIKVGYLFLFSQKYNKTNIEKDLTSWMPYLFPRYFAPIFNSCKCYNSILQYWFYEINIRILAANLKKSGCGALLIRRKILMLVSENQHRTIFSGIFCLMFLIDGIKPNVEKKFKPCFIFYETV